MKNGRGNVAPPLAIVTGTILAAVIFVSIICWVKMRKAEKEFARFRSRAVVMAWDQKIREVKWENPKVLDARGTTNRLHVQIDADASKADESGASAPYKSVYMGYQNTVTNAGEPAYFGSVYPSPWWPIGTNGDIAFYTNRAGQRLHLRTFRDLGNAIDFTWTLP